MKFIYPVTVSTLIAVVLTLVIQNQNLHSKVNKVAMELNFLEGVRVSVVMNGEQIGCVRQNNQVTVNIPSDMAESLSSEELKKAVVSKHDRCI